MKTNNNIEIYTTVKKSVLEERKKIANSFLGQISELVTLLCEEKSFDRTIKYSLIVSLLLIFPLAWIKVLLNMFA